MLGRAKGLALVALIVVAAGAAQAQTLRWHLLLEGQAGDISSHSGTVTQGLEDTTRILAYGQNLYRPLSNGVPGQLELRPIRLLKAVDGSSPRIAQALATSETITTCVLTLYQIGGGPPTPIYEIELTGAQIVAVSGAGDGLATTDAGTETVSLLFQSLKLTDIASGQSTNVP